MKWEEAKKVAEQGKRVAKTGWSGCFVTKYGRELVLVDGEQFVPDKLDEFELRELESDGADWVEVSK